MASENYSREKQNVGVNSDCVICGSNGNLACYHSVQNLLSFRLLSTNVKVRTHKTIILPVVLYGCETWSLTVRQEHKLRVFENRVLRKNIWTKEGWSDGRVEKAA
jgi:hypothetical protein